MDAMMAKKYETYNEILKWRFIHGEYYLCSIANTIHLARICSHIDRSPYSLRDGKFHVSVVFLPERCMQTSNSFHTLLEYMHKLGVYKAKH